MTGLRLEVDFAKIGHNARELVGRTAHRNISVTAVTKSMLGSPELARVLIAAGVSVLGDSRIDNIERMRSAGINTPMLLLRSPMPSQIQRVVQADTMSVNTEVEVLSALASVARASGRVHQVLLMVELGDLREGVMPEQLHETVRFVLGLPFLRLAGVGANLACRNGVEPSVENMGALSAIVELVETTFSIEVKIVSGGNSANLDWALNSPPCRINNLRLGESVLLGREPLQRRPIPGLHTDSVVLVAEVIESNRKPTKPWGRAGQNSFGETPHVEDRGDIWQTILAVGRQDTDPSDLTPPTGVEILAASSDHLIVQTVGRMSPGAEIRFEPGYSALLRSMTSPFVTPRPKNVMSASSDIEVSARALSA